MNILLIRLALPVLLTLFGLYRLYEYYKVPADIVAQRDSLAWPLTLVAAGLVLGVARYLLWKKSHSR